MLHYTNAFFSSSYRDPPDLHSFPTRRSSDLLLLRAGQERRRRRLPRREPGGRSQEGASAARGQDRKSTRLNSSHMSISYAVFCLKKKKLSRADMGLVFPSLILVILATLDSDF